MYWRRRKKEVPKNSWSLLPPSKFLDDNHLPEPPRKPYRLAVISKILGIASSVLMVLESSLLLWVWFGGYFNIQTLISVLIGQSYSLYYEYIILWAALTSCLMAIIFGVIAQHKIRKNPEIFSGVGAARTGIILGTITLVLVFWLFSKNLPMLLCFLSMGLVYWILIRGTIRLKRQVRTWLIIGYAVVHLSGWGLMHLEAHKEYVQREMEPYFNNIEKQLIERKITKEEASRFVKEERNRLAKSVIRTRSLSPFPGILLCEQDIGIYGETDLYLFTGRSVERVWAGMVWL